MGQEEKEATEDEMVGWHHQLFGHEQTLGDSERQGNLACCSPWGHKESDVAQRLNNRQLCAHWLGVPGRQWIMCQRALKPPLSMAQAIRICAATAHKKNLVQSARM